MAQINPHFIYNTLHTIIYMAKKIEATDIVDMTRSFISVLHDAVKISDGRLFVSLKQELDVVDKYLIIQKYRYRDRFAVEYELDESLDDCLVPKTILQPLVENSLLHGILPTAKAGRIKISTIAGNESMTIQIEDDGAGMSREAIDKLMNENQDMQASAIHTDNAMRSIGLPNVHQRIQYLCGEKYGLAIDSEPGRFTRISISLPINRVIPEQK
jgi:two-component system sensor histidine kinase YesM